MKLFFDAAANILICTSLGRLTATRTLQNQPCADGHTPLFFGRCFDGNQAILFLDLLGGDLQRFSRSQEISEFHVPHFAKQHQRRTEIVSHTNHPHGSLVERFEHHHARHHRETREVILQVLLVGAEGPLGNEALSRFEGDDSVELAILHCDHVFSACIGNVNVSRFGKLDVFRRHKIVTCPKPLNHSIPTFRRSNSQFPLPSVKLGARVPQPPPRQTVPPKMPFRSLSSATACRLALAWCVRAPRLIALLCAWSLLGPAALDAYEPGSAEFFEQKIRPVLVKHCYRCHSSDAEEIGGSLWLDSAGGMRQGGDSGPAISPGDAEASVLISAIRYQSSEMPPDEPLPEPVIADFVAWIDAGAVDPRTAGPQRPTTSQPEIDLQQGRTFWAFRPIIDFRRGGDAAVTHSESVTLSEPTTSWIDAAINRTLKRHGVAANSRANATTRLRRLAFDLTGLPPDPALQQRWLSDPSDEHWEQIVDQLLRSRGFAQHWARHWMDIARYADSNGSDFNATYHEAWRYRDYLIDSFDNDRPLDELIRQQIAGDLLPADSDQQRHDNLVATTFLMLSPKMLSERDKAKLELDVVDEQIDTIGRAFLGLTLGCARCHDHKFDPIPTEDYYALAGIFKSTQTLNGESQKYVSTFNRTELPVDESVRTDIERHKAEQARLEKALKAAEASLKQAKSSASQGIVIDDSQATKTGRWVDSTYSKGFIGSGYVHDDNANKGECSIEFRTRLPAAGRYTVRFAFAGSGNRAKNIPLTLLTADGPHELSVDQRQTSATPPWTELGQFDLAADQDTVVTIRNDNTDGYVLADAIEFLPLGDGAQDSDQERQADDQIAVAQAKVDQLKKALSDHNADAPPPLPFAMAPRDFPTEKIADSPIHIRGEVRNLGTVIPRGFLQVCSPGNASIESPQGSGRLELAHWLTDPDNPLVSRVLANRIWMHLFGEGIVRTVDNFGSRGQRPSHPELLDALATELMRNGWQLKPLIRQIVTSETYNRSSSYVADSAAIDPENRWLWRAHRKRLTAESVRDAMLIASGSLTDAAPTAPVADKGVLVTKNTGDTKSVTSGIDAPVRSIYLPVIRGYIAPLITALDGADPDLLVGKRPTTNVPGQALVLINSEHVNAWAEQTAARVMEQSSDFAARIDAVYRLCLSRAPNPQDRELAEHYLNVSDQTDDEHIKQRLTDLVAALFASTEFRLLD